MSEFLHLIAEARGAAFEHREPNALATFQQCIELDPEDPFAYVGQAIWYQQRHDNASAIREWVHAWELDPQNQAIRRALVNLTGELPESSLADAINLLRADRVEEAADLLRQVRRERPDAAVALKLIGALWVTGAQREAAELARAVHGSYPQSVNAALYVAALEDRAGRTLRSREAIARAEHVDPGLTLCADLVRQVGLQNALDQYRASRTPLAATR
ncbi:MAG: hypothetical protein LC797_05100 [Chloroflexi bacterium]|nr:hypothetical protein [Chloroflexota bacterium]